MRNGMRLERQARLERRLRQLFVMIALMVVAVILTSCGSLAAEAQSLENKGDLKGAVAVYREALRHDPNDVNVLAHLGSDLMLLGNFDEALPIQERVVALDPKDVQTRVELAFNYLNHQNQPAKAVQHLTQAVAVDPSAKNLTFLAQAQIKAGDSAGAEKNLDMALKTDPKYGFSYVVLIGLLQTQHRTDEAAQVRAQALQQGVDSKLMPQSAS
jgi:Tfp pilus assembly protein PilF